MISLNPIESRVFGVVIEKALTTPDQYPMSLNGVMNGCSQKSNRDPVLNLTEDECFDALESLRGKQLIVRVEQMGARVHKFKHLAVETLKVRTAELAILAELLLRGPQTLGELRGRASRMSPLESLDRARDMLRALRERPEPYVREVNPLPGSRAERYAQLFCPELHPIESSPDIVLTTQAVASTAPSNAVHERIEMLETELRETRSALASLCVTLGQPDPFAAS